MARNADAKPTRTACAILVKERLGTTEAKRARTANLRVARMVGSTIFDL
ncbi:MAG: hypothetical protein OXI80_05245 [Caldilineaceae bacterium]|nr:hypothetical protein [Caldilineaceae bacterium]